MSIVHGKPKDLVFHVCTVKNIYLGSWELALKSITLSFLETVPLCTLSLSCNVIKSYLASDDSNSSYFQQETPLAVLGVNAKAGDVINSQLSYSKFKITHPQADIKFRICEVGKNEIMQKNILCTLFFDIQRTY